MKIVSKCNSISHFGPFHFEYERAPLGRTNRNRFVSAIAKGQVLLISLFPMHIVNLLARLFNAANAWSSLIHAGA